MNPLQRTTKLSVIACVLIAELLAVITLDWFYFALATIAYALLISLVSME